MRAVQVDLSLQHNVKIPQNRIDYIYHVLVLTMTATL